MGLLLALTSLGSLGTFGVKMLAEKELKLLERLRLAGSDSVEERSDELEIRSGDSGYITNGISRRT